MTVPGTSAMCAEESLNGSKPRSRFTARTLPKESEVQDEKLGDKEFILRGITRVRTTEREEATSNVRLSDTCPNSCPIPNSLLCAQCGSLAILLDSILCPNCDSHWAWHAKFNSERTNESKKAPRGGCSRKGVSLDFTTVESRRKSLRVAGQFAATFWAFGQRGSIPATAKRLD